MTTLRRQHEFENKDGRRVGFWVKMIHDNGSGFFFDGGGKEGTCCSRFGKEMKGLKLLWLVFQTERNCKNSLNVTNTFCSLVTFIQQKL